LRIARSTSLDEVALEELADPLPGPGEVVCRVLACGVCGSDVSETYVARKLPCVLGHEVVGEVLSTGPSVSSVAVGDRVAANGDVANKVGTYAHALAAQAAGIPFVVAGPTSSVDASLASGDDIAIEERDADEVRRPGGELVTLPDVAVRNPAFDVTPAELISAFVCERGVAQPPTAATIAALLAAE
jgi:methylthioribose-1-phosphate isomerase